MHRDIWWHGGARWPRVAWLVVQAWLWLRWVLCLAWLDAARAVARLGADVSRRWETGRARQFLRVMQLALGWCIPPEESYRFGLVQAPSRALDFVYDQELPAYHRWRSAPGPSTASLVLLQDKVALAIELGARQIPVVATTDCVPKSAPMDALSARLRGPCRVFCKSRSGHAGRGAFTAWRTSAGLAGRTLDGSTLPDTVAVEDAWRRLRALDDALIQPCLTNHPALASLGEGEDAITIRYISRWHATGPACLSVVLEAPAGLSAQTRRIFYCILPVDADAGRLLPWPRHAGLTEQDREIAARTLARVPEGFILPDWPLLVACTARAHARFPDLWAIAWDWVLTPAGPVLLEGNTGWGTAIPQMLHGGFLAGD